MEIIEGGLRLIPKFIFPRRDEVFPDHDAYSITAQFLKDLGHDVVTAGELGQAQTDDSNTSYSYW